MKTWPASGGRMTEDEENRLLDELLDVLDQVVDTSGCADMVPLWLIATRSARKEHLRSVDGAVSDVPPHIRAWRKEMRSKYAGLAAWRHAVVAERILPALEPRQSEAVHAMYFTPCEDNAPPYSWSKASSRHPAIARWPSPSFFDLLAKKGCRESVVVLRKRLDERRRGASVATEARVAILGAGARDGTLRDILRYRDLDRGKDER